MQWELKTLLSKIKKVSPQHIFLGNGSDEAIDLVFRAFCEPEKDNVVAIDPTYGMYQVCADVNNVEYRKVLLDENFQFSAEKLLAATDERTKLIFLCSPNNPTGNDLLRSEIEKILREFEGLVILDEAYNDFSEAPSFLEELDKYPNLVVFQTFPKAWFSSLLRRSRRSLACEASRSTFFLGHAIEITHIVSLSTFFVCKQCFVHLFAVAYRGYQQEARKTR